MFQQNGTMDQMYLPFAECLYKCKSVPIPGLGTVVSLVLIHPADISERWDGSCLHGKFSGTLRLVAQHGDLSTSYK